MGSSPKKKSLLKIDLNGGYSGTKITIISSIGQTIYEDTFEDFRNSIEVNLQGLRKGIYFVQVENESIKTVKKIIKN